MNEQISISLTGEDEVICYERNNSVRTIDCGCDAIIQIHSITAARVTNTNGCNPTSVIDAIDTQKLEYKRNVNPSVG